MHATSSVNETSNQSILSYGMNQLGNLARGTLSGLSTGVRSVCHLPVSLWNGLRSRYEEHGMTQAAFDVGQVSLGGAVLVKMNQIVTEIESGSYQQFARTLTLAGLAIWAYKHSGKMTQQFREIKTEFYQSQPIPILDQSGIGEFVEGARTPGGQSVMTDPSWMSTRRWLEAAQSPSFAQFVDGSQYQAMLRGGPLSPPGGASGQPPFQE